MSDNITGKVLHLKSSDDRLFQVDMKIVSFFKTIKTLVDNLGSADSEQHPIPLMKVDGKVFEKMIEWAEYHKDDQVVSDDEEEEENKTKELCEWDQNFLKLDRKMLLDIILAANYLDAKQLLDAACRTVADMIKGKSVEQIRADFNITNDFTPEEEEKIKKETAWCTD